MSIFELFLQLPGMLARERSRGTALAVGGVFGLVGVIYAFAFGLGLLSVLFIASALVAFVASSRLSSAPEARSGAAAIELCREAGVPFVFCFTCRSTVDAMNPCECTDREHFEVRSEAERQLVITRLTAEKVA